MNEMVNVLAARSSIYGYHRQRCQKQIESTPHLFDEATYPHRPNHMPSKSSAIRSALTSPKPTASSSYVEARRIFPTARAPRFCQHFRSDMCIFPQPNPLKGTQISTTPHTRKIKFLREGRIKSKSPFAMLAFPTSRF